jgi:hypothetical protein
MDYKLEVLNVGTVEEIGKKYSVNYDLHGAEGPSEVYLEVGQRLRCTFKVKPLIGGTYAG